jgi:tRNA nucleotidyltransferase/poly(A) polymerase
MPKLYKVGGTVRDSILGVKTKDIDFTFVLDHLDKTVEEGFAEMRSWMQSNNYKIHTEHPDKFTIRGKFPPDHAFAGLDADFVMARKEIGYYEGTRNPMLELGTLEDDLIRRDFTINAMAEDEDGEIIDLFGGQDDLRMELLRTPKDPMITLMDDPLRLIRAMRFCITKDLVIHDDIWDAMKQPALIDKLDLTVSGERIREEIEKMMKFDTVRAMRLITDCDDHMNGKLLRTLFKAGLWLKPTFKQ